MSWTSTWSGALITHSTACATSSACRHLIWLYFSESALPKFSTVLNSVSTTPGEICVTLRLTALPRAYKIRKRSTPLDSKTWFGEWQIIRISCKQQFVDGKSITMTNIHLSRFVALTFLFSKDGPQTDLLSQTLCDCLQGMLCSCIECRAAASCIRHSVTCHRGYVDDVSPLLPPLHILNSHLNINDKRI